MQKFLPTRSLAIVIMALGGALVLTLALLAPFTAVRGMTVLYVAMLFTGIGMFLRERVFPTTSASAPMAAPATTSRWSVDAAL